jgi:hypothetical protein
MGVAAAEPGGADAGAGAGARVAKAAEPAGAQAPSASQAWRPPAPLNLADAGVHWRYQGLPEEGGSLITMGWVNLNHFREVVVAVITVIMLLVYLLFLLF